jgi:hypothetical protein
VIKHFFAIIAFVAVSTLHAIAQEPPITIDVRDADISDVIALLAAQSGMNIVADG